MNDIAMNVTQNNYQPHFSSFDSEEDFKLENLSPDLVEAIKDTRKRRNLHGPFKTAAEAVASMLED